jgi:hypothetical protein
MSFSNLRTRIQSGGDSTSLRTVVVALGWFLAVSPAQAQDDTPPVTASEDESGGEDSAVESSSTSSSADTGDESEGEAESSAPVADEAPVTDEMSRLDEIERRLEMLDGLQAELEALRKVAAESEAIRAELEALKSEAAETQAALPPAPARSPVFGKLTPFANVTVRYDNIWTTDPTDLQVVPFEGLPTGDPGSGGLIVADRGAYFGGFRTKVRAGLRLDSDEAFLVGGIRMAVGESPNPSGSFVPLGDVFRPSSFGLDQAWFDIRPFKGKRDRLSIKAGKMPNPFWRGKVKGSGFASEMIFDNDINPSGASVGVKILDLPTIQLYNVTAWYVIQDTEAFRFRGLTGETSLIANQFRLETPWLTAAVAYYGFENLNAGLKAPGISSSYTEDGNGRLVGGASGAVMEPGTSANLMRAGLQATNNRVDYGPGAQGFMGGERAAMRLLNVGVQGHVSLPPGKAERVLLHLMVDYAINLSAPSLGPSSFVNGRRPEQHALGGSMGMSLGEQGGAVPPIDFWGTYRFVQADATLAALADSDLGRGTEYHGGEFAASVGLARNFKLGVAVFNFFRFPDFEVMDTRLFVDLIAKF